MAEFEALKQQITEAEARLKRAKDSGKDALVEACVKLLSSLHEKEAALHNKAPPAVNVDVSLEEQTQRVLGTVPNVIKRSEYSEGRVTGSSTKSGWVQVLPKEDDFKANPTLLDHFREPDAIQLNRLALPSEDDIDQYLAAIEEPVDGSNGTRALFAMLVASWQEIEVSSRPKPMIGSHKPDLLHRKSERGGEQSIRIVGDVKGLESADSDFAFEQQGQIFEFLIGVLSVQPYRTFIYGYLTDCRRFEFYKATKVERNGEATYLFERSGVFRGTKGWRKLRLLTFQSDVDLGFESVEIDGWELDAWLGTGGTAAVFTANSTGSESPKRKQKKALCKVYLNAAKGREMRDRECTALEKLSQFQCIPKVIARSPSVSRCGHAVLLKTPQGLEIPRDIRLPVSAFAPIVLALEYAHQHDLFHNDIAPQNLFGVVAVDGTESVILDDFGSATSHTEIERNSRIESRPLYYGSTGPRTFGARADLCALVRSIFVVTQSTFPLDSIDTAVKLDGIMRKQLLFWEQALELAYNIRYRELYNFLRSEGRTVLSPHY